MTFQKGLGAVHSMSHALGGHKTKKLHHGTLNAVFLPHVLRFNASACSGKYAALLAAMGLAPDADIASEIEKLNRDLGMPASLSEMGVTNHDIEGLSRWGVPRSLDCNKRPSSDGR
jgi:alcohol dehydrogenase class IV